MLKSSTALNNTKNNTDMLNSSNKANLQGTTDASTKKNANPLGRNETDSNKSVPKI